MDQPISKVQSLTYKLEDLMIDNTAIVAVSRKGIIISWDARAQSLMGFNEAEMVGKSINALLYVNEKNQSPKVGGLSKNTRKYTLSTKRKDNSLIVLNVHSTLFNESGHFYFIYTLREVDSNETDSNGTRINQSPSISPEDVSEIPSLSSSGSEWLISYVDLTTLLLVFFILAYSLSDGSLSEVSGASETIQEVAGGNQAGAVGNDQKNETLKAAGSSDTENNLSPEFSRITESIMGGKFGESLEVIKKDNSVNIRIKDSILFESGNALLSGEGNDLLDKLTDIFFVEDYLIAVEGHTDSLPISNKQFPSNWELSASRATEVVRYLIESGIEKERLKAIGYADTKPLVESESLNVPQNRRVELAIYLRK